jgi:hypothetical protein
MRPRVLSFMALAVLCAMWPSPVAATGGSVERLSNVGSVLAVALPVDFPVASLMRANCSSLIRIERSDGSALEIQDCLLSDEPVMIQAFQGAPPSSSFVNEGGPCIWSSDYWFTVAGTDLAALRFRYTVTPSGHVHVRSEYPAEPLACE